MKDLELLASTFIRCSTITKLKIGITKMSQLKELEVVLFIENCMKLNLTQFGINKRYIIQQY